MEHHVYFAVFGFDHDPRQLDLLLGQSADDYWHEGESFSEVFPDARRRENRWILSSQLDHTASHRDHFEKLLYKLKRLSPQLQALDPGYRFGIGVSHYFVMDDPAFCETPICPAPLAAHFRDHVADDLERLDELAGRVLYPRTGRPGVLA